MSFGLLTEEQSETLRDRRKQFFGRVYIIQDAHKDAVLEELINTLRCRKDKRYYNKFKEYRDSDPDAYEVFIKILNRTTTEENNYVHE